MVDPLCRSVFFEILLFSIAVIALTPSHVATASDADKLILQCLEPVQPEDGSETGRVNQIVVDAKTGQASWVGAENGLFFLSSKPVELVLPSSFRSPQSALQKDPIEPFLVLVETRHPCSRAVNVDIRLMNTGTEEDAVLWRPALHLSVEGASGPSKKALHGKRAAFFDSASFDSGTKLPDGLYQLQARATVTGSETEPIIPLGNEMRVGDPEAVRLIKGGIADPWGKAAMVALGLLVLMRSLGWIFCRLAPLGFLRFASSISTAADIDLKVIKLPISGLIGAGLRHRDRVLDAWVARNRAAISTAYQNKDPVVARDNYVLLPVKIGRMANDTDHIDELEPCLRRRFAGLLPRFSISGDGGCGKTALATWIGDRVLNDPDSDRPGTFPRVPVLLDHDLDEDISLTDRVKAVLISDYGADWIDRPLVEALLARGRILLILDRVSELGESTQLRMRPAHKDFPTAAFIVTSRVPPELDGTPAQELFPLLLTGSSLSQFVFAFKPMDDRPAWTKAERHEISARIERFFNEKPTTVLLIKLALEAMRVGGDTALRSRGDLIREYIRRLDAPVRAEDRPADYDWPKPLEDAQAISWSILEDFYHMREIPRQVAIDTLGNENAAAKRVEYLVDRLQVFEWRGAGTRLSATLDPVVEHLAALYLLDRHGRDDGAFWRELGDKIAAISASLTENSEPTSTDGFVDALYYLACEDSLEHTVLPFLADLRNSVDRAA